MMRSKLIFTCLAAVGLVGCNPNTINEDVGGITGAVAGGVIGNQFGDGTGKTLMTAVGAIIGHKIGSSAGAQLDEFNQEKFKNTMETTHPNHWKSWVNPNDQNTYRVRPGYAETVEVRGRATNCRPYQMVLITPNETVRSSGYACKHQQENWEFFKN